MNKKQRSKANKTKKQTRPVIKRSHAGIVWSGVATHETRDSMNTRKTAGDCRRTGERGGQRLNEVELTRIVISNNNGIIEVEKLPTSINN